MFARFFIERPRFAIVISCFLLLSGAVCGWMLPIKQYPDVAPPQVCVSATYPGADAETLARTVAVPLEEAINGVEGMIYMSSTSSSTGTYDLTVTFATGTDPNMDLVKVQNRIQQATALLPGEVTARGVSAESSFSNILGFIGLVSPNGTQDSLSLTNYASSNVKNTLGRIPGMGNVQVMGAQYSMRIWVDPQKLASLGMTASDVAAAITSQNKQAALGSIGSAPGGGPDTPMVYSITAEGRLTAASQFEDIIVKRTAEGALVRLKDVARVELGSENYTFEGTFRGMPSAMIALSQGSDANALNVMSDVKKTIEEMRRSLPNDMEFIVMYDTTDYVKASLEEILMTLLLTFSLVVAVCYIFLQDWRVTLVPTAAIPVSIVGTFIGLGVLGYSFNTFSLFGMILVIGTVVDDAIVVVERVLYLMEHEHRDSMAATEQAMRDVAGPMIATTLIFLAIFVPVSFLGGMTGVIYRQFGVTMSFAVIMSTTVAFTLSPAMCAHLLHDVKPKQHGPLAWFNRAMEKATNGFVAGSMWIARRVLVVALLLGGVCTTCWLIYKMTPASFIPDEDQGVVMGAYQLPEGATYDRTKRFSTALLNEVSGVEGIDHLMGVQGFSMIGGAGENVGTFILPLKNWAERRTPDLSQESILGRVNAIASQYPEANVNVFAPPTIPGLGMVSGLSMELQTTMDADPERLANVARDFISKLIAAPEFLYAFTTYTSNTPHIFLDIDRVKAERMGVQLGTAFSTLQTYFGTAYINDINLGTQVNKVIVQSDWPFRDRMNALERVYVRNTQGLQVPVTSFAAMKETLAPRSISRFNLYPSASINIVMAPGFSTGDGMARIAELSKTMPLGYTYSWSGQTYQEQQSGGQFLWVIVAALVFGYLFLVAQYESWSTPMAVMLSLPVAVLGALIGIYCMGISLSIFTELGILLLVGLATKNAILIVEFAKEQREVYGLSIFEAAAQGARQRFRSVLMTAFTCVLGVAPMLVASGAGASSRLHVGTTMFFGMTIATVFGIFLIPGLFATLQRARESVKRRLSELFSGKDKKDKKEENANED